MVVPLSITIGLVGTKDLRDARRDARDAAAAHGGVARHVDAWFETGGALRSLFGAVVLAAIAVLIVVQIVGELT